MPKKQKPKRDKKYIQKGIKTKPFKREVSIKVTTKNMIIKGLIFDYIKWNNNEILELSKASKDVFEAWKKLSYKKESERQECNNLFLEWFKKQKSKNLKVYAFSRDNFIEYKIKEVFELKINDELKNLFTEITPITKNKREASMLNCTVFERDTKNAMVVYNSNNEAFNLDTTIIEKEKVIIKKEQIIKQVNKDKTLTFQNKITKFLKSKQFEKAYLNSFESVKQEILNIIK
jgi:hypothetical protein